MGGCEGGDECVGGAEVGVNSDGGIGIVVIVCHTIMR